MCFFAHWEAGLQSVLFTQTVLPTENGRSNTTAFLLKLVRGGHRDKRQWRRNNGEQHDTGLRHCDTRIRTQW